MRAVRALLFIELVACRIGGPSANPEAYVSFPDATADGGAGAPSGDAGASKSAGDDGAAIDDDAESFDSTFGDDGGEGGCSSPVAVCDPVRNTGCKSYEQCDVNPQKTQTPTGRCVFHQNVDASACTSSFLAERCAAHSTCVDGGCRLLCFCNADCPIGQCCSDTSGPVGFTLCEPCP